MNKLYLSALDGLESSSNRVFSSSLTREIPREDDLVPLELMPNSLVSQRSLHFSKIAWSAIAQFYSPLGHLGRRKYRASRFICLDPPEPDDLK